MLQWITNPLGYTEANPGKVTQKYRETQCNC